jgi:predicted RNase H-like HicB family nuclease
MLIEQDEDNMYVGSCPVFKGCHSDGEIIDKATKKIHEVIEMCFEDRKPENSNHAIGFREIEMQIAV